MPRPSHPNVDEFNKRMDALEIREACLFCAWEYRGTALAGREQATAHRLKAHPEIKLTRRRAPSHLKSFRQAKLKQVDIDEIYGERDKRAKLIGIEISAEAV